MPPIRDTNLKVTKALPAAGATNYTDAIDLIDSAPGLKLRNAELELALPATPSLVDTKKGTFTLQDSADGASFADVPTLSALVVTGANSTGAAAVTRNYKAPETLRRYLRLKNEIEAAGGSNIAVSVSLSVIY